VSAFQRISTGGTGYGWSANSYPGFQSCFYGAFVCIWVWLEMIYHSRMGYMGCLLVGNGCPRFFRFMGRVGGEFLRIYCSTCFGN
jgi:hypothetical protein